MKTLKWPTQLPILMQNHSGGDSVTSIYIIPDPPTSPSLISLNGFCGRKAQSFLSAGGFSRRLKGSNPDLRENMPLIRSWQGFLSVVGPVPQANKLSHLTDLIRLQEMFEPQTLYDPSRWYVQYTPSLPQCMKNAGQYHSHG